MKIELRVDLNLPAWLERRTEKIMAKLDDIKAAQAAEKGDLVILVGLISQLLAAFAAGSLSPADAQALLDEVNSEDADVKTSIASIQAALPAPPPPPPAV